MSPSRIRSIAYRIARLRAAHKPMPGRARRAVEQQQEHARLHGHLREAWEEEPAPMPRPTEEAY